MCESGIPLDTPGGVCDSVCSAKCYLADFLHLVILVFVCVGRKCNASHYHNKKFKHHVKNES
jgi:hypothetical protein